MRTILVSLLVGFTLVSASLAQQPARKSQTPAELQSEIAGLLDQPQFAAMRWGMRVLTAEGNVVFDRDSDKSFTPASNMKLYTTAAALDAFGPEFKIRTSVYASKPLSKTGVLSGDLILYGRGDPNISARFDEENRRPYDDYHAADRIAAIEQLADQLRTAGLTQITGNVLGDESYFAGDPLGVGWEWDDLQFYYGAEVSALTVNDNAITYVVTPARVAGEEPVIETKPRTDFPAIINHAVTTSKGDTRIGVHRQLDTNRVEFFGTIPRGAEPFKVNIAVHDPAAFAAALLKESLRRRGIRVQGRAESINAVARRDKPFRAAMLTELAFVESQPLAVLLRVVNKSSQNLHAELLLRQLGASNGAHDLDDYGRPKPTLERANEARKTFLIRAGVDPANLSLRDGSGLARSSMVTPRATSRLLEFMLTHSLFRSFTDSLPVAGLDGTLENRMKRTPAEGNVRAKTGTLTYVNALSGYLTTLRGQQLIFSFYANNYTAASRDSTAVMDAICSLLAGFEGEL